SRFQGHSFYDPRTLSARTYREMAETERAWVDQSDIVFAYLNRDNPYAFGTCFEIGYAVAHRKTVIFIDEKQVSSSKWIAEPPVHACATLEEGINKLTELLAQGNSLIAESIVESLHNHDFTVLVRNEFQDDLVSRVAAHIFSDATMYTRLML